MSEHSNVVDFSSKLKHKRQERSDAELLTAWVGGDEESFNVFYKRYKDGEDGFYSYALKFCNNSDADAKDVMQTVMTKFIEKLFDPDVDGETYIQAKFGDSGSAKAYWYKMIYHQAISTHRRAYKRREEPLEVSADGASGTYTREVIDEMAEQTERAIELQMDVVSCLWRPVEELTQSVKCSDDLDDIRLEKAINQAETLCEIFKMRMEKVSLDNIAQQVGMDRKTLQKRRELIAELLEPLRSSISEFALRTNMNELV